MPRPSKFTEPVKKQLLDVLRVGGGRGTACAIAGISDETLRTWLKRGEEQENERDAEGNPTSPWAKFLIEVKAAEAALPYKALGVVYREVDNRPDLAWKTVERLEPRFAPPQSGSGPQTPQVTINLSLTGSTAPMPAWVESREVVEIDAEESPALPAGDSDTAAPEDS